MSKNSPAFPGSNAPAPNLRDKAAIPSKRSALLPREVRVAFLSHLAETANVTASAKGAGITTSRAYQERRKSSRFRSAWHAALCEGYVKLETHLLSEALTAVSGPVSDATLKAQTQKCRIGLNLLSAHRKTVREEAKEPQPKSAAKRAGAARKWLVAKLGEMHQRHIEAANPPTIQ